MEALSETVAPAFQFPKALSDRYQPKTIDAFAGLKKERAIFSRFVKNPYPSAWLFVGASGVGKTSMALAIAAEMNAEVHHIGSQQCKLETLEAIVRTCQFVPLNGGFHVIVCDEADVMSDAAQKYLLSKLDSTEPVPNTVWIFSCNGTERLEARFLSRCRVVEFSSYGMSEAICEHLTRVWNAESGGEPCPTNLKRLVAECHNNVRESLMKLELELMGL